MLLTSLLFAIVPLAAAIENGSGGIVVRSSDAASSKDHWTQVAKSEGRKLCYLSPQGGDQDDAKAIAKALNEDCRSKGLVVLSDGVYNMKSNITTTNLDDVEIHHYGQLLWSTNVDYWLGVSMPIDFQNQSTVWHFGGDNVVWDGHGKGTLDGNGQHWYNFARSRGNVKDRPSMINYDKFSNSIVRGVRYVQSQMWTMTTTNSKNLLFEDIYINNTSTSEWSTLNTDGIDILWSDNITLSRWDVSCGDDNISLKGNSSNIRVYDSVFHHGQGFAIGSLGQYEGKYEYIKNFYARNITMYDTRYAIYLKTWPGVRDGYPPNGGGGGLGHAENIVMEDVTLNGARGTPFWFQQCEQYQGRQGRDCDSSKFTFSDIFFRNVSGTMRAQAEDRAAYLHCSKAGGCKNVTIQDFSVRREGQKDILKHYYCENVHDTHGFKCEKLPKSEQSQNQQASKNTENGAMRGVKADDLLLALPIMSVIDILFLA